MWKPIILDVECIVCNKSLQKINHDPREVSRKMGKIVNRRSRTPNWSVDEKQYLLELINEHKEVITKTTNGPNYYEEKDLAWNAILRALTNRFGNKFHGSTIKKVKTQWQNMKRIAREEITLNGPETQKYTRQSLQVCSILDLLKDGILKTDHANANLSMNETVSAAPSANNNANETVVSNVPDIEVKTERIDEDLNQPCCSKDNFMEVDLQQDQAQNDSNHNSEPPPNYSESSSSTPECNSPQGFESPENETPLRPKTKNVSANTDTSFVEDTKSLNQLLDSRDIIRLGLSTAEKQLKLDFLKEERHVIRAIRETAELNKITAEQRLKHVLWMNKQEKG